jgi:chromosome segregation ATPase
MQIESVVFGAIFTLVGLAIGASIKHLLQLSSRIKKNEADIDGMGRRIARVEAELGDRISYLESSVNSIERDLLRLQEQFKAHIEHHESSQPCPPKSHDCRDLERKLAHLERRLASFERRDSS